METTWSSFIDESATAGGPSIPDLEGGIVFAARGVDGRLVRHAADGTRLASMDLTTNLDDLATDASGRIVYAGVLQSDALTYEVAYGEVDQSLAPVVPQRAVPWQVSIHEYQVKAAPAPDGTIIVAGGDPRGAGRFISKLAADGTEVWTSPWPVAAEPDDHGNARVAGVAALGDGTVGMVLTSGDLYAGDLWLEAFQPDGTHAWTISSPGLKIHGVTATADTFVVTDDEGVGAYLGDGTSAWSFSASPRGLARRCTDASFVVATPTGYVLAPAGGDPVAYEVDLLALEVPTSQEYDGKGALVEHAICSLDGSVILVATIDVSREPSGSCESEG